MKWQITIDLNYVYQRKSIITFKINLFFTVKNIVDHFLAGCRLGSGSKPGYERLPMGKHSVRINVLNPTDKAELNLNNVIVYGKESIVC